MKREKGFMLLDVVIAMFVLSIGVTCLMGLTAGARQSLYLSQWKGKAINMAQSELERIKDMEFDELLENYPDGLSVETESEEGLGLRVLCESKTAELLEIGISANWVYAGQTGAVVLSTLISRR